MSEQDIYQQAEQELSSIADFVRFAATQFHQSDLYFGHGTDNPWDEAVAVVLQMLDLPADYPQSMLGAQVLTRKEALDSRHQNSRLRAQTTSFHHQQSLFRWLGVLCR